MKTAATSPLTRLQRIAGYTLLVLAPMTFAARAAFAQTPPAPDGAPATQAGDPPGRVARLNYMAGAVTTEPAGASDWSYAAVNRPLTTGDQLWNDANARSELHIGSTAVRLGSSTSLDVMNLDDTNAQLKIAQGTLSTRVREVPSGTSYEIDTPNVALGVTRPGDYRVDVAPDGSTTTVTVRSGALTAYGNNGQVPLEAGQQITFTGTDLQEASVAQAPAPDAFDEWAANRDTAEDRSVSARYVSRDMPGYEDLDANGTWNNDPQYGAVWVPNQEPAGWAPYHDGHWAWVAPWGWTWIDDAPWGFAPYHYGRWAYVRSSWCWVPGPLVVSEPPVYAPALVAFVGGGGGGVSWGVSLAIGGAAAAGLAWFPLGPGDVWHPGWGGWSPRYYQRVNQTVIVNNNKTVNINNIHNTYINYNAPGAVTAVPATAFVHGRPVAHFAQHVDPRQWRNARINPGAPGVAPVKQSFASGLRPATYHPPQALAARPVVATRAPATPAVYRDPLAAHLAQAGGRVPGAGAPVVRPTAAAPLAGRAPQLAARGVRIVSTHSPVITPTHGPANAAAHVEQPGAQPHPEASHGEPPHAPAAAAAEQHAQPNNGVPRPPAMNNPAEHGAQAGARPAPAWTQPHAPITQQHMPMNEAGTHAPPHAEPQLQPHAESPHVQPQAEPRVDQRQAQPQAQPHNEPPHPQPQAQPHYEQPRPQPQPQPHYEQPRPQPQPQPHYEQPRPQPQPQPHYEQPRPQPQPQPHYEQPRPQPQPQPHYEQPRPQPQPQPHIEPPRPQPQPQPRPAPAPHEPQHEQQHAAAPSHAGQEHHRG